MDINSSDANRDSVEDFSKKFYTLLDAGAGVIQVRTHEVLRAALEIRKLGIADGFSVREWDIVNGFRDFDEHSHVSLVGQGDGNINPSGAFMSPLDQLRDKSQQGVKRYYVYVNFHPFMESPDIQQLVTLYTYTLPASNTPVIIITPDIPLTVENETILSLHFDPPGFKELRASLETVIEQVKEDFDDGIQLDDEDISRICYVGAGMTKNAFDMYASLAVVEAGRQGRTSISAEEIATGVAVGKTEVVNQSEVLELYPPTDIKNVGGLDNLKDWIKKRKGCYSDEAREFGIEPPKGIVLVGIPGTGKSLVAKAVASEFGIPLVRLDFGRVFNSLVGASESRMRQALRQVENMAPVVLFCVDGKTEVTIADGSKERIEDMYRKVQEGHSYTLRGMDPNSGELIALPMRTIIRTQGKPMLRVTTDSGRAIEVTHDHRLLVNRQGERAWIHAEDLVEGDDLVEV